MSNRKRVKIREVEIGIDHQIPQESMTPETKAPVMTPETQEEIDTGAIATLAPMRVIDTGAQAIILAKTSDAVIKAPVIDRTATIPKVTTAPEKIETPVMTGGQVMTPTANRRDRYRQNRSPSIHEPTCHGCGVKGHYIAKCPDAPDRCTACKGLYHTIDECPVEIRKTRPITKRHRKPANPNRRRSSDDKSSRKQSLHLSKVETETSGSESSGSEN